MQFNTMMEAASWDETNHRWVVSLSSGREITSRYLVTAVGLLSKQNYPQIPGISSFKGEMYHSGSWPESYDFSNKRVGVVGNGSTGVQIITTLADKVKQLVTFQRHPQYVVPAGDREIPTEVRSDINNRYDEIWKQAKKSTFAFGFHESTVRALSVSEEEREAVFEEAWKKGGGFNFMFGTFCDISYDEAANKAAADFIKKKIRQTVQDPAKAEKLIPTEPYARRPLCDTGYYEKFNLSHVDIVDTHASPITEVTEKGIRTLDGKEYELDVIIFATGFDAVDGSYNQVDIRGVSNIALKDAWSESPCSYLGISVPSFPNLFMVLGPNSPFVNNPPVIESQVEFISDLITRADKSASSTATGPTIVEAELGATQDWTKKCEDISANSIFRKADSWLFGANVAGKKKGILFYLGGLANYRSILDVVVQEGYKGYTSL